MLVETINYTILPASSPSFPRGSPSFITQAHNMKLLSRSVLVALAALQQSSYAQDDQSSLSNDATVEAISDVPLIGFGTWNLDRSNASDVVAAAIHAGYRHIDCAAIYGNEKEVGDGIRKGMKKEGLKRKDIWITSKLWNNA